MNDKLPRAGFDIRLSAGIIDLFSLLLLHVLCWYGLSLQSDFSAFAFWFFLYLLFIFLNPVIFYRNVIFTHLFGGTLGKLLIGLRTLDLQFHYLSWKRSFFRQVIGYQFSSLLFFLGFFWISKDPEKEAWHDKIASTQVVIASPKMWIIGLLYGILFVGLTLFTGITAWHNFSTGPLRSSFIQLWQETQQDIHKRDSAASHPSPYPTQTPHASHV